LAAFATSPESILIFGRRASVLATPLLRAPLVAASAIPPAAPTSAAPPATSGTFALLAALPTVFIGPAPLLECAPFELGDFELALFGFAPLVLFAAFGLDRDLDFVADFALLLFGADRFFALDLV
jgi:hypothetical protein